MPVKVGFDGDDGKAAVAILGDDATLRFTAEDGTLGSLSEFRSGHYGDATNVQSGVNLGGATLVIDLADIAGQPFNGTLISVDELIGQFGDITIEGLGNTQDATITVDYTADTVSLELAAGTGQTSVAFTGDASDAQASAAIWTALNEAQDLLDAAESEPRPNPTPQPAPVDPTPVDPAPVDPDPVDPAPVDPAPVDPTDVVSGFNARHIAIASDVASLADIDFTADAVHEEVVQDVQYRVGGGSFYEGGAKDDFAIEFTGTLSIETAGEYTFWLSSDDGSKLTIGDETLGNDGLHATRTQSFTLDLATGDVDLELLYFEAGGGAVVELDWAGPDTSGARTALTGDAVKQGASSAEVEQVVAPVGLTMEQEEIITYAKGQDFGTAEVSEDGTAVTLANNAWKALMMDVEVTEDTVLKFDFTSEDDGEIQAIGFDNDNVFADEYLFQLSGSQDWADDTYATYDAGSGTQSFEINVGQHYTGDFDRLVFVMDDDRDGSGMGTFSNIEIL